MAISLNDNIRINAGKPSEAKYLNASTGLPYTATTQVTNQIALSERHVGLTVNVNNIEYWFKTGITNSALVTKTVAGGGSITGGTNGLTKVGNNLTLGGAITNGYTSISLDNTDGNVLGFFAQAESGNGIYLQNGSGGASTLAIFGNGTSGENSILAFDYNNVFGAGYNGVIFDDQSPFPKGIQYKDNYSSTLSPRSLVDKGFVTGLTSNFASKTVFNSYTGTTNTKITALQNSSITGGTNGLSIAGKKLKLGGTLTGSTDIQLSSAANTALRVFGSNNLQFVVSGSLNDGAQGIVMSVTSASLYGTINSVGSSRNFRFHDDRTPTRGIEYDGDYKSGFTPRSFVDKGFVTGSTLASNGLTKVGNYTKLGGSITATTYLTLAEGKGFVVQNYNSSDTFYLGDDGIFMTAGSLFDDVGVGVTINKADRTGITKINIIDNLNGYEYNEIVAVDPLTFGMRKSFSVIDYNLTGNPTELYILPEQKGIVYGGDYSASFGIRTLVDKGYVTGATQNLTNQVIITGTTTLTSEHYVVLLDNSVTPMTIYLPLSPIHGQRYIIKDVGFDFNHTLNGNGRFIDSLFGMTMTITGSGVEVFYNSVKDAWYKF